MKILLVVFIRSLELLSMAQENLPYCSQTSRVKKSWKLQVKMLRGREESGQVGRRPLMVSSEFTTDRPVLYWLHSWDPHICGSLEQVWTPSPAPSSVKWGCGDAGPRVL